LAGSYPLIAQSIDTMGNLKQSQILNFWATNPFSVLDGATGQGINGARINLYTLSGQSGGFIPINNVYENIQDTLFTNSGGVLPVILPKGTYRAQISDLGYTAQTVTFTIGGKNGQEYPTVLLTYNPLNILSDLQYFLSAGADFLSGAISLLYSLGTNSRVYNLVSLYILLWAGPVNFSFFWLRSRMKLTQMPLLLFFHLGKYRKKTTKAYIRGLVIDEQGNPVPGAVCQITDSCTQVVLKEIGTNRLGHFYIKNAFDKRETLLTCTKQGFSPYVVALGYYLTPGSQDPVITLAHGIKKTPHALGALAGEIGRIMGSLFEVSLVVSFVIELFSLFVFGFAKTAPFVVLSFANWVLWLFYTKEPES
jgi:hypothetical protein